MPKPKVALLVNLIAPYRQALYARLASKFDLSILHGGMESNRSSWKELKVEEATVRQVAGWQFSIPELRNGKEFDRWFVHIHPGYITELVRHRPAAVITVEMGFRTLVALTYGTLFRKPVWIWWGGTVHTEQHVGRFRNLVRRFVARWAKHWISYGLTSTEYLQTLGVPRQRILQIQNCVDERWFDNCTPPALDVSPKPVLMHVGRMVALKGIKELLKAAAQLQREGVEFSLVLLGDGPDSGELQELAQDLELGNVHFYPVQSPKTIGSFYTSADVLIFPTMQDVWGLVANEAVLSGLPVLCSKYAGCAPELFDPEAIFDPTDEQDFLAGLRRAVSGTLPSPDVTRLKTSYEVAEMIITAVLSSLREISPNSHRDRQSVERGQTAPCNSKSAEAPIETYSQKLPVGKY